jgi:pimeloyl-ACP methyl ester carboxylesterase
MALLAFPGCGTRSCCCSYRAASFCGSPWSRFPHGHGRTFDSATTEIILAVTRNFGYAIVRAYFSGLLHLVCNNSDWPSDVRTYQRAVARDRVLFPMLGAATANIWPCAFWPAEQLEPPVRIGDRGPSNILIVQGLRDPGSPLPAALEMRAALGNRARLLTVDHGGHKAYLYFNNACTDEIVTRFLVSGERPATDRHCP